MIRTSVVILNWNGMEMLRRFLPSVIACSQDPEVEICVADNASTDASCEVVEHEFPSVRLIRLDRNYGFAEGYNRALSQVEAKYVVLLNSDVEVTPGWLNMQVDYMEMHPQVAACQPKILSWHHKDCFEYAGASGGFIDRYGYPFCRGRIFETVEKDCGQYDDPLPVFWATGAALLIRLDLYRKVGGLDSRFFAHMEEIDLCWRLRSRGYTLMCLPFCKVYHVGGATLKKENPRKTFLNFRNNLLMLYKNLSEKELKRVMRVRCILDYVAAAVFLLKGDWGNVRAVIEARREFHRLRSQFTADRQTNLVLTVDDAPAGYFHFSILWQSKIRGKKVYSLLPVETVAAAKC